MVRLFNDSGNREAAPERSRIGDVQDAGGTRHHGGMEIETLDELATRLTSGETLSGARFQNLDLSPVEDRLLARTDLEGLVVLGGSMSRRLAGHLTQHKALVFPAAPHAPVDPYRESLYAPEELYDTLEHGYATTSDARAYEWSLRSGFDHDAYISLLRATHDVSVTDALDEWIGGSRVVGVMGGHALSRASQKYAQAAHLAHRLAEHGLVVATGGGPGAMEAANLGAYAPDADSLEQALGDLAEVPGFAPSIDAWARSAFRVRDRLRSVPGSGPRRCSVGIPTWFYGHEPPNVFCHGIAKFFSNALREDGLLARASAGIVVLPGAAGTVQEVFQAVTPRYYSEEDNVPALVLVGREHWTRTVPIWQALQALGHERALGRAVHLVDGPDEAATAFGV